jgi:putative ABC transport system permease protein
LAEALPPGLRLEVPESRTRIMSEMIEAFQTNLAAMSLLALLVGAFLIYNTMTFSVLRRRQLLATLRLLGVTRQALFQLLLLEAGLLGLIGTALGLALGVFTAHYLVQLVTRTINDLYFVLTVTQLILEPLLLLKGILIGLGITLLAALAPAIEAAGTVPVSALRRSLLEQRVHRGLPWVGLMGLAALVSGLLLVRQEENGLTGGFAGLFLIIAGYSLLMPLAVVLISRLSGTLSGRGSLLARFALRGIGANLSRTGLSIAALSVAVATTLGVSIMITSFRATVEDWLGHTLRSDIYVSALSSRLNGSDGTLLTPTRSLIQSVPGVAETSGGRRTRVSSEYGPVDLMAIDMGSKSHKGFGFVDSPVADIWPRYRKGEVVLISEPYAYRHRLKSGDELLLHTPQGPVSLPIGGVFYDYGSDQGVINLDHATYARLWGDKGFSTLGVFLQPGMQTASAIEAIRKTLNSLDQEVQIRSNREIREHSMEVFDRTFAITQVLRLLVIGVAFVGVLSALMALQLERTREQAVLRATGVTPGQLSLLTLLQTGLMGLYAGILSLPLGWLMSVVLIEVINRRSFGWSITTLLPPMAIVEALFLALGAALLAGVYPAWRMGRVQPALALREE